MILKNLSDEDLYSLARDSYIYHGSTSLTARLILQGLERNFNDLRFLGLLADFYVEKINEVAAVLFYYIFERKSELQEKDYSYFMTMFSDAMYQFGFSKFKEPKETPVTLKDISDSTNWIFDINQLKSHSLKTSNNFDSIENWIFSLVVAFGQFFGLYDTDQTVDVKLKVLSKLKTTNEYYTWLNSYPDEIQQLIEIRKN